MINLTLKIDTKILDAIMRDLNVNTDEAVRSVAADVESYAKQFAPVDTGALRNSIHTEPHGELTCWVQDGVNYGIYQELGTYKMAAQPFMTPAIEKVGSKLADYFKELF